MKIAAFDIATNTGIAVGVPGGEPIYWSKDFGTVSHERRYSQALQLADRVIRKHKPDMVFAEKPVGGTRDELLIGLYACIVGCAAARGIPVKGIYTSTVRSHFLGKHLTTKHFPDLKYAAAKKEIKRIVMRRCQALGWNPEDDDQADALAMLDYAFATEVRGYQAKPVGGLF